MPGPNGGTSAPRITNTSLTGNNGDAVERADDTAVAHIVIAGSAQWLWISDEGRIGYVRDMIYLRGDAL